jgi:hypothetical protein
MATLYYNYDSITLNSIGPNSSKMAISATQQNQPTNVKYNDVPYFIRNLYFYKDKGTQKYYLVVENTSDPNTASNLLFVAIPLSPGGIEDTDIDNLLPAPDSNAASVTLTLNQYLRDGGDAKMAADKQNNWPTYVVKDEVKINKTTEKLSGIKTIDSINGLTLNGKSPATVKKTIMDWTVSCELLGEDEAQGTVDMPAAKKDSIDTLLAANDLKQNSNVKAVLAVGCMAERYGNELEKALRLMNEYYQEKNK